MVTVINPAAITIGSVEQIKPDLKRFDAAKEQVSLAVAELKKYEAILSKESQAAAMNVLKQANDVSKAIEKKRKDLVAPWNDGAKAINAHAKTLVEDLDNMIDKVKRACLAFQQAEEKRALEAKRETRRVQLLAMGMVLDEKNNSYFFEDVRVHAANLDVADDVWQRVVNEATAKLLQQAEEKLAKLHEEKELLDVFGDDDQKLAVEEKIFNATSSATAPITNHIPSFGSSSGPTKLNGAAKVWKFEVTDATQVPREYLTVDETAIRRAVQGGARAIPGVRIFQDDQLRIR